MVLVIYIKRQIFLRRSLKFSCVSYKPFLIKTWVMHVNSFPPKYLCFDTILQRFKEFPNMFPFFVSDTTTLHFLIIYFQNPSLKMEPLVFSDFQYSSNCIFIMDSSIFSKHAPQYSFIIQVSIFQVGSLLKKFKLIFFFLGKVNRNSIDVHMRS
jgi:hypothetical protein